MSTDYVPREGDTIKVKVTLGKTSDQWWGYALGTFDLDALIASDLVELIACAEPDWQPGDIGQHIKTGELYRYLPDGDTVTPWLDLAGGEPRWKYARDLAGKLVRCTLTPEGDDR